VETTVETERNDKDLDLSFHNPKRSFLSHLGGECNFMRLHFDFAEALILLPSPHTPFASITPS